MNSRSSGVHRVSSLNVMDQGLGFQTTGTNDLKDVRELFGRREEVIAQESNPSPAVVGAVSLEPGELLRSVRCRGRPCRDPARVEDPVRPGEPWMVGKPAGSSRRRSTCKRRLLACEQTANGLHEFVRRGRGSFPGVRPGKRCWHRRHRPGFPAALFMISHRGDVGRPARALLSQNPGVETPGYRLSPCGLKNLGGGGP